MAAIRDKITILQRAGLADYHFLFDENLVSVSIPIGWLPIVRSALQVVSRSYLDALEALEEASSCVGKNRGENGPIFTQDDADRAQQAIDAEINSLPKISQIKEKFGSLNIYSSNRSAVSKACFSMAEILSIKTCEVCGSPGMLRRGNWIKTLCDHHHEMQEK